MGSTHGQCPGPTFAHLKLSSPNSETFCVPLVVVWIFAFCLSCDELPFWSISLDCWVQLLRRKEPSFILPFLPHTDMKSEFVTDLPNVAKLSYSLCLFSPLRVLRYSSLPWPFLSLPEALRHYWCFLKLLIFTPLPLPWIENWVFSHRIEFDRQANVSMVWQLDPHQKLTGRNFCVAGLEQDLSEYSLKLLLSKKIPSLYTARREFPCEP